MCSSQCLSVITQWYCWARWHSRWCGSLYAVIVRWSKTLHNNIFQMISFSKSSCDGQNVWFQILTWNTILTNYSWFQMNLNDFLNLIKFMVSTWSASPGSEVASAGSETKTVWMSLRPSWDWLRTAPNPLRQGTDWLWKKQKMFQCPTSKAQQMQAELT